MNKYIQRQSFNVTLRYKNKHNKTQERNERSFITYNNNNKEQYQRKMAHRVMQKTDRLIQTICVCVCVRVMKPDNH